MAKSDAFDPKAVSDQAASEGDAPGVEQVQEQAPSEGDAPGVEQVQEQAPIGLADKKYADMPAGGLRALAGELYPDDRDNPDAMRQHVADLLALNSDRLRNEDSYTVGVQVRIS